MPVTRKPLHFLGSSLDDLRAFRTMRVVMPDSIWTSCNAAWTRWIRSLRTVGPGVREIRVRDAASAFRVNYLATRPEGVYVLHCFQKKTQRTRKADIDLVANRYD